MRQALAFLDVALADAEQVAASVIAHLIASQVIDEQRRAADGADAIGFVTSELRAGGVDVPVASLDASVEVQIGRARHGSARGLMCECGAFRRRWDASIDDAIARWIATGEDALPCERCGVARPFASWRWVGVIAFTSLAFVFDGWPDLAPAFVRELSNLTGSRIRVVQISG